MTGERASLESLFARRLIIQTGKGGTGKTTVSAALALLAARRGKRTLLVEVDSHDRLAPLFGRSEPVGYEIVEVAPGLHALNLDPQLVIVDFFKTHVRFKTIYQQILDSRIFQYFYAAAPGLRELICLGKVWRLLGETRRKRPIWDLVVMDAPATGHGLAILNIAQAAYDTLFGPMKQHAREIRDMLRNPALTVLDLCAIPEEMPVNECADLYRAVRDQLGMALGLCFLSGHVSAALGSPGVERLGAAAQAMGAPAGDGAVGALGQALGGPAALSALARAARLHQAYAAQSDEHRTRLAAAVPLPIVEIPYLFDAGFDPATLERVAAGIEAGVAALAGGDRLGRAASPAPLAAGAVPSGAGGRS